MAETTGATLGDKRERWIGAQEFATQEEAERARTAYNQGAIDALHHQGILALDRASGGRTRLIAGLCTRPVPLQTRSAG